VPNIVICYNSVLRSIVFIYYFLNIVVGNNANLKNTDQKGGAPPSTGVTHLRQNKKNVFSDSLLVPNLPNIINYKIK